jgi:hypothetical protein
MKSFLVNPMVRWAAAFCIVAMAANAEAVTQGFTDGVLQNNGPNRPFFTSGGPSGFIGTATDKVDSISMVTGTAIEIAGDSSAADLSDGNGLPMGVRFTYDLSFTVQSTSANSTLSDGGNNGLAVFTTGEGTTNQNRINPAEQLRFFDIAISNASVIDPLGLIQPGTVSASNALWRALRSTDIGTSQVVTTSSDAGGTADVTVFGPGQPKVIQDNLTAGAFPSMGSVYVTTSGTGNWRLKAIGYQADLSFEPVTTQPAERRTFKFADPAFNYDNQPTHSITDRDTVISIAAIAPEPGEGQQPTVLDTNTTGVGVLSQQDIAPVVLGESAARRIGGDRNEALHFSFSRDVSLESITLGNFNAQTASFPTGETMVLSYVPGSGVNPFEGLTGYSGNYLLAPDGLSLFYTMNEPKADGGPFLIPFGMGDQSEIIVEAETVLALTSLNVQEGGFLLNMITANLLEIPELEGDYNRDGTVDAADYVVWRKNNGTQEGYDTWRANFGNAASSGADFAELGRANSAAQGVPEPASTILLAFAVPLVVLRRFGAIRVWTHTR